MDFFFFNQIEEIYRKEKKNDYISKRANSEYLSTYYLRNIIVKFVVQKKCLSEKIISFINENFMDFFFQLDRRNIQEGKKN